jgi:hypothetical protein
LHETRVRRNPPSLEIGLEFWASAEVHQPAYPALNKVRHCVESFLNAEFANSTLSELHCMLRYVPIVMPEDMHHRYPARSKLRKKEKIYDCAPILDYHVFADGGFENQLHEYLRGIALAGPHLASLGASTKQVQDFETILAKAAGRIVANDGSVG